jgi:lysophospholipase L1-like esterase
MSVRSVIAVALAVTLSACSGGGGRSIPPLGGPARAVSGTPAAVPLLKLVGVGDSLTAGVQSNGLMGADVAPNPFYTGTASGSPFPVVQATQTHGFWALLWSQANSAAINNPATSPLPLIAPPGVGQILVPADAAGDLTSITTTCGANNAIAFGYASALGARLNAGVVPYDVAVPGQTVHEALYQIAPQSGCGIPANAGVFGGLANIVASENTTFYPILGNFGRGTTQVAAAAGLHGTIDTVWLGSNDLLKFASALGALPPTDPAALRTDVTAIVKALQASGAKVAVANLFDVLDAAFFIPQPLLPQVLTARLTPTLGAAAAAVAGPQLAAQVDAANSLGSGGYLTVSGLSKVLGAVAKGQAPPQLGGGDFVPDALAAKVATLNTAYNAAIAAAVAQTGAVLVDIHTPLAAAHAAGGIPISAKCCGFLYGEGIFSLDGLHPSNTIYAVIANLFIKTLDTALGTSIPAVDVNAVYATDIYAPH